MVSIAAPFAQHPDLAAGAPPPTRIADQPIWTLDMDDMLRAAVRRLAFDFEVASQQIRSYVLRVRACGGILPEVVVEPLYTARACRERWSQLDLAACHAYRNLAQPQPKAAAAPLVPSADDAPPPLDDDEEEEEADDSSDDDYGIVDLNALRAQRLGGMFGAAPSGPTLKPRSAKAKSGVGRKAAATPPVTHVRAAAARPAEVAGALENGAPLEFAPLFGRSQQLAELEQLAAELSVGAGSGGSVGNGAPADAPDSHRAQAATTLLEPLGDLKRRMAGLEALLADDATDMAAKLGEVAQVHREMAELQSLAHKAAHTAAPNGSTNGAVGVEAGAGGEMDGAVVAPPVGSSPLRYQPATDGGLNLEAALNGLDLDGLLAELEKGNANNGDE